MTWSARGGRGEGDVPRPGGGGGQSRAARGKSHQKVGRATASRAKSDARSGPGSGAGRPRGDRRSLPLPMAARKALTRSGPGRPASSTRLRSAAAVALIGHSVLGSSSAQSESRSATRVVQRGGPGQYSDGHDRLAAHERPTSASERRIRTRAPTSPPSACQRPLDRREGAAQAAIGDSGESGRAAAAQAARREGSTAASAIRGNLPKQSHRPAGCGHADRSQGSTGGIDIGSALRGQPPHSEAQRVGSTNVDEFAGAAETVWANRSATHAPVARPLDPRTKGRPARPADT